MTLPIQPPIKPMLAKLARSIPDTDGVLYEPKWDGFRCIVFRDGDDVQLTSRNQKPFNRYFPELVPVLAAALPDRCVVDGEIVVAHAEGKGLDFDALQQRIHPAASRVDMLAEQTPAEFVAFDLLALGDDDLMGTPFGERRALLEQHLVPNAERAPDPGHDRCGDRGTVVHPVRGRRPRRADGQERSTASTRRTSAAW